jgi:hypothetical protein
MPGSYLIDAAREIVFSRGWGVGTEEELNAHDAALRADPRFDPSFRQIVDFRDLTEIRLSSENVHGVAQRQPFRRDARRAFVVASGEVFGLTRMFASFAEANSDQFAIFRAIEPAFEWVGLDPTTPWPEQAPDWTFSAS